MLIKQYSIFFLFLMSLWIGMANAESTVRDPRWAIPVKVAGIDNLYRVSDTLYRSAQPTESGMKNAVQLGVGTVISLRSKQKDILLAQGTDLKLLHVSMRAWNPTYQDAVTVMRALNPENSEYNSKPILLHCYHGADRTGMMVALYRMVYQGWSHDDAVDEMLNGGYGYHPMWQDIVTFVKQVDVNQLRRDSTFISNQRNPQTLRQKNKLSVFTDN